MFSTETRLRMSEAKRGIPRTRSATRKTTATRRHNGSYTGSRRLPVLVHGVRYESRTLAALALGITPQAISSAIRSGRPGFRDAAR